MALDVRTPGIEHLRLCPRFAGSLTGFRLRSFSAQLAPFTA